MERQMGVEPTSSAWRAGTFAAMLLTHLVLAGGIEPPATGFGELKRSCTFIFLKVLLLNY